MGLFLLMGCTNTAVSFPTLVPTSEPIPATQIPTLVATNTAVPTAALFLASLATATPPPTTPIPIPTNTMEPAPTLALYQDMTIAALQNRSYGGGVVDIVETLEKTEHFTRYLITYPSDGLTIYGYMNVPNEGDHFPVVMMLHGYMPVAEYETVTYTKRYADNLAEAGYFVIHPNLRNYPPSDDGQNPFRIGYAIDVLNLLAIIREQSQDDVGYLRRANTDNIHLWGHSMGGSIALRVLTVLDEVDYLQTAVLYAAMSGDEKQNFEKIRQWRGGSVELELSASPADYDAISPIEYVENINVEIQVHHSVADDVVPVQWSQDLCTQLEDLDLPHQCYFYEAVPHTFRGLADLQLMERVRLFYGR